MELNCEGMPTNVVVDTLLNIPLNDYPVSLLNIKDTRAHAVREYLMTSLIKFRFTRSTNSTWIVGVK